MDCRRAASSAGGAPLANTVWALLLQLSFDRVRHHFGVTAAQLRLAPAQAMALHELEADRSISMRELAGRLKCDPSTVTGLVDRLEARGLVERRPDPRDRRVKGLALTPAGQQLRARLAGHLYAAPHCVTRLSERDQHALHDLLAQIVGDSA